MRWDTRDLDAGPVPLWAQIADRLRTAVEAGVFCPGDKLPGEADLNRRFGVSRTTARAALDRLEQEGRIVRRSGRGSIVLPPRVERPLNLLSSFAEDMRSRGLRASYVTRAIRRQRARAEVTNALDVARTISLVTIDRVLCANGRPIAASTTWLAPHLFDKQPPPTVAELDHGSLYRWLETRLGTRIAHGTERIEAGTADLPIADRLQLAPGAPVLIARRLSRSGENRPVEYVVLHYRADRYSFQVELVRP